jgi:isoquinoline 1-oxidoreductase subunit beta
MIAIENVSRRGFLEGMLWTGGFVLCARLLPQALWAEDSSEAPIEDTVLHPTIFVGIDRDGTVHVVAHRSDMGTGTRTSLPRVVADELDADWARVKVHQAVGDARYGDQDTDGSHSIRDFFDVMRQSGATARLMLVTAAAGRWNVPVSECFTDTVHTVAHPKTARTLGYGELAPAASRLPVPRKEDLKFKPRSAWRYIGKPSAHYDVEDLCTGKPVFGMDVRREGMVYAAIAHPPVLGGKIKSFDDKAALQVRGVSRTVAIETFKPPHQFQPLGGLAVIADNTWSAFKGRKQLQIEWDNGGNASFDSDSFRKEMRETSRKPGKVVRNIGDVDAEFGKGGKIFEADYYTPLLAHVSMEPPVAVAEYRAGKVVVWTCTQNPQAVQETVAKVVGIKKEDVTCHVTLLGGGFGRKSKPDYAAEAALLSQKLGKPVKVVWSREDDVKFDYFHTTAAMYLKAALDANGKPTAWLQRSVFPPIGSTFGVDVKLGDSGEMAMGWNNVPFDLANHRAENGEAAAHVRIGWMRSVANVYHAFAVQSFADELAHAAGRDPLEYLLALIGPGRIMKEDPDPSQDDPSAVNYPFDTARLRQVTELAAEKAGWGKRKFAKGSAQGIAVHRSFLSYVATVVEVEVSDDGAITIPRVDTVVDAGTIVNPDTVRAQFEGAAVFGTSIARSGEITASQGVIRQSNFHDYPVTRMNQAPYQVNVHIVDSEALPAGVGEPGVPPFAPALCNAVFAATGKRVRELPLSRNGFS